MSSGFDPNTISVDGLDELMAAFRDLPVEIQAKLDPAVTTAGNYVIAKARVNLNRMNGVGGIGHSLYVKRSKRQDLKLIGYITHHSDVSDYAAPLELGHLLRRTKGGYAYGSVAPRPWLRPAADESRETVQQFMVYGINQVLDEMGGKK